MQNKNILFVSCILLILGISLNIFIYRKIFLQELILNEMTANNINLVDVYKNNLFKFNYKLLDRQSNDDVKNQNLANFISKSINFFNEMDFLKVEIFNINGNLIFSSNDEILSQNISLNFKNIYKHITTFLDNSILGYNLSTNKSINILSYHNTKTLYNGFAFVNYITISISDSISYTIAIYQDITHIRHNLLLAEYTISILLFLLFILFISIIFHKTNYAQKIIDQQQKLNKLLEIQKLQAEKENVLKSQFLANVSHELRTPLNAIIGFSEIILSEHSIKPQKCNDYVNDILISGKHLLSVINDILDYSKISMDKLKVDMTEVDLIKTIKSSVRFIEPRIKTANITLKLESNVENVIIFADPKRLRQAVLNILSNSVKFTHDKGIISIEIIDITEQNKVKVVFKDSGIGIEEADIPKALSSFGQVDNSFSRKYDGTGLGLPLTKRLVALMNGTFDIESKVGVGTTVTFLFDRIPR
jgi:two-component system cell cycle sensor histidine kinase PleC